MASEIRVNSLSSRTGLSTVTFTDTGPIFSGITTFQDNSGFNVGTGGSIFSPASNTVTLGTNSAERLRITSDGDMGLGTASPRSITNFGSFAINGTAGAFTDYFLNGTRTGTTAVDSNGFTSEAVGSSTPFRVITNGSERLRIASNGNIGIGTDNPGSNKLQVQGSSAFYGNGGASAAWGDTSYLGALTFDGSAQPVIRAASSKALIFQVNQSTEALRITSDGKIGVGVASPQQKLDVVGSAHTIAVFRPDTNSTSTYGDASVVNNLVNLRMPYGSNPGSTSNSGARWGINFQGRNDGAGYGTDAGKSASIYAISEDATAGYNRKVGLSFYTSPFDANQEERLRITSDGKVGINYNNPSYMLEVHNPNPGNDSKQLIQRWINTNQNTLELNMYGGTIDQCQFAATNSEQTLSFLTGVATGNVNSTHTSLLLTQNRDGWFQGPDTSNYGGGLFIGAEASPYGNLCALRDNNKRPLIYMGGQYPEITLAHTVASNTNHGPTIRFATYVQSTNTPTGNQFVIGTNGSGTFLDIGHAVAAQNLNVHSGIANYNGNYRFRVTTSGCQVNGSLSKSSGSFRIDHPLVGLSTTRDLVHSFIEGPQADLIYRGVVDLVDGTATVNIDTAGRMTEGTFEVLCTNVSCFTSNETDWTAVKGSVSGNILTITAQDNTSTATVSWMVVGERKDPHMIDTDWTDENGRVITEPLKSS